MDGPVANRNLGHDLDWFVLNAIVVDVILALINPSGQLAQFVAQTRFRGFNRLIHAGSEGLDAITLNQLKHAVAADLERCGLRA